MPELVPDFEKPCADAPKPEVAWECAPVAEPSGPAIRLRQSGNKRQIFDVIRKKWVADLPEERVRQELLHRLTGLLGYPSGQFSIERRVHARAASSATSGLRRPPVALTANPGGRYDALLRTPQGLPLMLIECKAPGVALNQAVFDQAAAYNYVLNVPFLLLCNGPEFLVAQVDHERRCYVFAPEIPDYRTLTALFERR